MTMVENTKIMEQLNKIELLFKEQNLLQKEMLTLKEAATVINVSESHMYKLTHKKEIPHYCPNGKILYFKRIELVLWMQRNRKSSREELESAASSYVLKNRSL